MTYMNSPISRRRFLQRSALLAGAASFVPAFALRAAESAPLFKISLAEWSLHKALFAKKLTHLDFPRVAKSEFGITAIEHVNQFWMDKAKDASYVAELKKITEGEGITNVLIMCDTRVISAMRTRRSASRPWRIITSGSMRPSRSAAIRSA